MYICHNMGNNAKAARTSILHTVFITFFFVVVIYEVATSFVVLFINYSIYTVCCIHPTTELLLYTLYRPCVNDIGSFENIETDVLYHCQIPKPRTNGKWHLRHIKFIWQLLQHAVHQKLPSPGVLCTIFTWNDHGPLVFSITPFLYPGAPRSLCVFYPTILLGLKCKVIIRVK